MVPLAFSTTSPLSVNEIAASRQSNSSFVTSHGPTTGERIPLDADGVRLLSPVIPSKVYGLAKNYEAHAQYMYEQGQSTVEHAPEDMVIFMKPSTSVIGPDDGQACHAVGRHAAPHRRPRAARSAPPLAVRAHRCAVLAGRSANHVCHQRSRTRR